MLTVILIAVGCVGVYFLWQEVQKEIEKDRAQALKREAWRKYAAKRRANKRMKAK